MRWFYVSMQQLEWACESLAAHHWQRQRVQHHKSDIKYTQCQLINKCLFCFVSLLSLYVTFILFAVFVRCFPFYLIRIWRKSTAFSSLWKCTEFQIIYFLNSSTKPRHLTDSESHSVHWISDICVFFSLISYIFYLLVFFSCVHFDCLSFCVLLVFFRIFDRV